MEVVELLKKYNQVNLLNFYNRASDNVKEKLRKMEQIYNQIIQNSLIMEHMHQNIIWQQKNSIITHQKIQTI